jgi:glutamine synthetase
MTVDTAESAPTRSQAAAAPSLAERAHAAGTTFILALFVTLTGKPCAKLVPVEAVDMLQEEGVGFAGYAAGGMGQEPKDPDLIALPDASSFTPIPFVRPGLALVHCDPHVSGEPWPYAPRLILKETIRGAADLGLSANVGAEVEYFLVTRTDHGTLTTADQADLSRLPCYDARDVTRMYDHLTEMSRLGQLRERPRGRQRPVRAELPLRRSTHHRRPCGDRPVSAVGPRRAARYAGHLHAQAIRKPHRLGDAHAPVAVRRLRADIP